MSFFHSGRPDSEFRTALILSGLFHAAVLAWIKLPQLPLEILGADAVLMVRLVPVQGTGLPQDSLPVSATDTVKPQALSPTKQELPLAATVQIAKPSSAIHSDKTPNTVPVATNPDAQDELPQEAPAVPVQSDRQVLNPRMVRVLLVVGKDGSVGQIIWGSLPSVTEETLHEMERRLRQKTYPATGSTYPVTEVIDVP